MDIAPNPLKKFEDLQSTILADKHLLKKLIDLKEKIESCKLVLEGAVPQLNENSIWVDISVHGTIMNDAGKTEDLASHHILFNFDRAEEKTVPLVDSYKQSMLSLINTVLADTDKQIQDLISKYDEIAETAHSLLNKQE